MTPENEIAIWKKVKDGNQIAYTTLYNRYTEFLYNYGLRITRLHHLVEDTIQETFSILWKDREKIEITSSFKAYLLITFRRSLVKKIKNSYTNTELDDNNTEGLSEESVESQIITLESAKSDKKLIEYKLSYLSPRQREAIFLKYFKEMKSTEIAKLMNIDVKGVYKLISKGLIRMRKHE